MPKPAENPSAACGSDTQILSRAPHQGSGVAMERSAKELFLNFMIVLITVLLMWLLVKTYQD